MVREFCTDRCRAAYREKQIQAAMKEATDAVEEAAGELARLSARLDGARQLLERYRAKRTRPRRRPAAGGSPELAQALNTLLGTETKKGD